MKRIQLAVLVILSACAGAALRPLVIPPAHAAVTQRWEYLNLTIEFSVDSTMKKLNDAGAQGWELQAVDSGRFWLKRPAP